MGKGLGPGGAIWHIRGMRMNHPDGKKLLALVRGGDYAHAGEEEAIQRLWNFLPKNPGLTALDAGCGRGGTAAYVQAQGWATVTGMDIDAVSIAEAERAHPGIRFCSGDIASAGVRFPAEFDLIYAFNAFYAFPDQPAALRALASAAKPSGTLALFDYVDLGGFSSSEFGALEETRLWQPLVLDTLLSLLAAAGWELMRHVRMDQEYRAWYHQLVTRFEAQKETLNAKFDPELVAYASNYYQSLLCAVEEGCLGGAMVYARLR